MQDQESLTYWDNIFADWESSGLKQREYCNRNNIQKDKLSNAYKEIWY